LIGDRWRIEVSEFSWPGAFRFEVAPFNPLESKSSRQHTLHDQRLARVNDEVKGTLDHKVVNGGSVGFGKTILGHVPSTRAGKNRWGTANLPREIPKASGFKARLWNGLNWFQHPQATVCFKSGCSH